MTCIYVYDAVLHVPHGSCKPGIVGRVVKCQHEEASGQTVISGHVPTVQDIDYPVAHCGCWVAYSWGASIQESSSKNASNIIMLTCYRSMATFTPLYAALFLQPLIVITVPLY